MDLNASFSLTWLHRLRCTRETFSVGNRTLIDLLADGGSSGPARAVVFVDEGVVDAQPDLPQQIEAYALAHRDRLKLTQPIQRVIPGEAVKNNPHNMEAMLHAIAEGRLCRRSYVIAIGGGAVLDAVGFAAAMAHRGVRLIRVATTTLAQADSAVGVKNGINAYGRKNYLGVFTPPWAVINDEALLETLPDREWICGFVEAVKVGLLKDAEFFDSVAANAGRIVQRDYNAAFPVIRHSAKLHFEHITQGGDPFELTTARPLDFGHWAAHKLEQLTRYEIRHGEAVAIGIAVDATYAMLKGWLSRADHLRIVRCLLDLGFALDHPRLQQADRLMEGLDEFREHLGGVLTIPMVKSIGCVDEVHEIDAAVMRLAIEQVHERRINSAAG